MAPKKARVSTTNQDPDRISPLPDSVISHILSFLPTEESVRTRVLSPRWKHLFSLVPVLDFKYKPSSTNSTASSCNSNNNNSLIGTSTAPTSAASSTNSTNNYATPASSVPSDRIYRFLDFVDWVVNSCNAYPLDKFHLKASGRFEDTSRLAYWITESVRLGVCKLDISMFFIVPQMFPLEVFTCKTLTELNISGSFVLDVPGDVCLPCARTISLFHVAFADGDSARRLFKSSPVLEDLVLCLSPNEDIQVIEISVPTLKCLYLFQKCDDKYELVLDIPNLEYLDYTGYYARGFYAVNGLKSLVKALIAFPAHFHERYIGLEKLLGVVSYVRDLRICSYTLEALQKSGRSQPILINLTRLEMKIISSFDAGCILRFLAGTPNLEVLVIENDGHFDEEYVNRRGLLFPEEVPPCMSQHLKEVEFIGFYMMEYEFKLVDYFLKNAEILHTLKIDSDDSVDNKLDMTVELLTLQRYSRTCQIVIT